MKKLDKLKIKLAILKAQHAGLVKEAWLLNCKIIGLERAIEIIKLHN